MSIDTNGPAASGYLRDAGLELLQQIEALPDAPRRAVLLDLAEAVLHHQATGDGTRLGRIVQGLAVSASLRERDDFLAAVNAVSDESWDEPTVDIADYLSDLYERRTRS